MSIVQMRGSTLLEGMRVLGLDLETTGFMPRSDRIVEFALVGSDSDGSRVYLQSVVNPGVKIPPESSRVHGIYDSDVMEKSDIGRYFDEILDLIDDAVLVGHNIVDFDWRFIEIEFARFGREAPRPLAILDTMLIARKLKIPRPHKLGSLCGRFGIGLERAHSADADAGATLLLLWKIMGSFPEEFQGSSEKILELFGYRP